MKNKLKRFQMKYNLKIFNFIAFLVRVSKIVPSYFLDWIKKTKIMYPPIFIVGCGHSGTSLLLRILGSHSKIHCIKKETKLFYKEDYKIDLLKNYFNLLTVSNGKIRWIEKSPKHINCIGKIFEKFPNAKVLLILRDGRDVSHSIKKRTGSVKKGIKRWVNNNRKEEEYWSNPDVFVLKYEHLITKTERVLKEIFKFINMKYERDIIHYYKKPKLFYSKKLKNLQLNMGKITKDFETGK